MGYYDGTVTLAQGLNLIKFLPDDEDKTNRIRYVYLGLGGLYALDYPQLLGQIWLGKGNGNQAPIGLGYAEISIYQGMWTPFVSHTVLRGYYDWSSINLVWFKPTGVAVGQSMYYYIEDGA